MYYNKYNNIIISKLIYYDEKNILPNAHQVKIIGYSLSKLEIDVPILEKQKFYLLNYKELRTTCANSLIIIMSMDLKLLHIQ